jgi:hypothetical protein
MKFIQHIPSFIDTRGSDRQTSFEFETKEELFSILRELGYGIKEDLIAFEITYDGNIMEVSDKRKYWWVCGRVVGNFNKLALPKWKAG